MNRAALLLALLALAVGARVLHAGLDMPAQMPGLERKYAVAAANLRAGEGFVLQREPVVPYVDRIPGYLVVLAGFQAVFGEERRVLALVHALIAAVTVIPLAFAGARLFGWPAGYAGAATWALFPPAWKVETQVLETGIGALAVALLLHALIAWLQERPRWAGILVAVLPAIAITVRADYLLVPVVTAVVLLAWPPRGSHRRLALVVILLPLLVAVPWAARNARVADGFFVSLGFGTALLAAVGESTTASRPLFGDQDVARSEGHDGLYWPDPARRDRERVERALSYIADDPASYARGSARRVLVTLSLAPGDLWPGGVSLKQYLAEWRAENPGRGRYDALIPAALRALVESPVLTLGTLAWGPLLLAAALSGIVLARRRLAEVALTLAFPAYGLAVHVPIHAEPRYFFPFAPPLALLAGVTFAVIARRVASSRRRETER